MFYLSLRLGVSDAPWPTLRIHGSQDQKCQWLSSTLSCAMEEVCRPSIKGMRDPFCRQHKSTNPQFPFQRSIQISPTENAASPPERREIWHAANRE